MEINLLEHKDFVFGAFSIENDGNGFVFKRMTPRLLDIYNYSEAANIRACCPSDIRIRFKTNSKSLAFKMQYGRAARNVCTIDISVGGRCPVCLEPFAKGEELSCRLALTNGDLEDVTINLPNLIEIKLLALEIDDGAEILPMTPYTRKLIGIGDSILQGMTCLRPSNSILARLSRKLDIDVHNIAVGGAVMSADAVQASLELGGTDAVLAFGINDFAQNIPLDVFRGRTEASCEILQKSGIRSFVVAPIPYPNYDGPNQIGLTSENYRQCIRDTVAKFPVITLLDGPTFFPAWNDIYADGCHPNDAGAAFYCDGLAKAIRK